MLWLKKTLPERHLWLVNMMESGGYRVFHGTKNAAYYCEQIKKLRPSVPADDFERIVGKRFSAWLLNGE